LTITRGVVHAELVADAVERLACGIELDYDKYVKALIQYAVEQRRKQRPTDKDAA
jgi:hypothetical protein